MAAVPVRLAIRDYDFVAPLALGDVAAEGIDLTLHRRFDAVEWLLEHPDVHGGEASFSRYLHQVAAGDDARIGLPIFVMREFRHRCFFVRRDSALRSLAELAGTRVGTDAWGASGNVWSRSLLRESGVAMDQIRWTVAPVNPGDRPVTQGLPAGSLVARADRSLSDMLIAGELDAVMCPWPPAEFHRPDSRIRRLYVDYRTAEREYYLRTRIFPAHHLVVLTRELVEQHPSVVPGLYAAFCAARQRSEANHLALHESSPWILADLEEQRALMGAEFEPYGCRANRQMVAAFCEEQLAQGLLRQPLKPDLLFERFEELMRR